MSQVSRIALRRCSQNVFVFVFVNFFGHVTSFHHSEQMYKGHMSLGLLLGGVLKMSLSLSLSLSLYLSLSIVFGYVMSSHHSEQMSQRSQVSRIALRRCSQNVFFFVIVFVFVFVYFFWSCHVFSSL